MYSVDIIIQICEMDTMGALNQIEQRLDVHYDLSSFIGSMRRYSAWNKFLSVTISL